MLWKKTTIKELPDMSRRNFTREVVNSNLFQELPLSTQALYFHFGVNANADGFISEPLSVIKNINALESDLNNLESVGLAIRRETGGIMIMYATKPERKVSQEKENI